MHLMYSIVKGNTTKYFISSIIHDQSVSDGSEYSKEMKTLVIF